MKYVETLGGKKFQVEEPASMIDHIAQFRKLWDEAIGSAKPWHTPVFTDVKMPVPTPPPAKNDPDALDAIRYMFSVSRGAGKTTWSQMSEGQRTIIKTAADLGVEPKFRKDGTIDWNPSSALNVDFPSGCKHDMRLYDSGWTREMYCTKCSHKEKA